MFWRRKKQPQPSPKPTALIVQTDGAMLADGSRIGLGVIVRNMQGQIIRWASRQAPSMTNNEAEYAALCLALELMAQEGIHTVHVYSDSKVMINQMRGYYQVHSAQLKIWHQRACQLARRIPKVTYTHIRRERNQLADALANEALQPALPPPTA